MQKIDYGATVIFEKINGNTVIENLVRPPQQSPNLEWIKVNFTQGPWYICLVEIFSS